MLETKFSTTTPIFGRFWWAPGDLQLCVVKLNVLHRYWDIRVVTTAWPWNPGYRSLSHRKRYQSMRHLWPSLTFYNNHQPISHCVWYKWRFQLKNPPIFPTPMYLMPPLKGFPLELGIGAKVKKLERWVYQMVKKVSAGLSSNYYQLLLLMKVSDRDRNVNKATIDCVLMNF